ncbi:MAG: Hsp20/alpha crystallin family protein [Sphaerobacter sp.]|nr:Hsp20/alpha crystallin family protein [Sphaerobacter sp.]
MIERWRPRADIERMFEEMDRLLPPPFRRGRLLPRMLGGHEAVDLYETPDRLVVKALVPGSRPEDIDISIDQRSLTLRARIGYTLPEEEAESATWHVREIMSGEVQETITLPVTVDPDQVSATLEDGVLTITLPKTPEIRGRRIPVTTRGAGR